MLSEEQQEAASYIRRWLWARFVNLVPDGIPQRTVTLHEAPDDVPADYHVLEVLQRIAAAAAKAERERACEAIREACGMCNGQGYTETSHAAHGCGGDESLCASGCPVEQLEQVGCEYCGRPIEAIRAESE